MRHQIMQAVWALDKRFHEETTARDQDGSEESDTRWVDSDGAYDFQQLDEALRSTWKYPRHPDFFETKPCSP